MTATGHEPAARHLKHRGTAPRAGLLAFLVLALAAAGAGFVVRAQTQHPSAPAAAGTGPAIAPAAYLVTAEAVAEVRAARFRISTTRSPASAVLTLDPSGAEPARTVPVDLDSESTEVVVRGLAAGRATWTVAAEGAPTVRGNLRIPAQQAAQPPPFDPDSATLLPGSDVPSADAAPPSSSPDNAPPAPPPATATPRPEPTATSPATPPPTPRPTGPASPYDPDDN